MPSASVQRSRRVMVVDDHFASGDLLREILTMEGYAVCVANCGRDALAIVRAHTLSVSGVAAQLLPPLARLHLRAIVAMERSSMAICPHTGLTIPECSCGVCLEAQMRRHRPNGVEADIRITRSARLEQRGQDQRRAA